MLNCKRRRAVRNVTVASVSVRYVEDKLPSSPIKNLIMFQSVEYLLRVL